MLLYRLLFINVKIKCFFFFNFIIYLSLSFKGSSSNGVGRKEPCCRGIYDFDAETSDELEFKEGDMIRLITRLDDNWYYLFSLFLCIIKNILKLK
jgi:hypothetical protein